MRRRRDLWRHRLVLLCSLFYFNKNMQKQNEEKNIQGGGEKKKIMHAIQNNIKHECTYKRVTYPETLNIRFGLLSNIDLNLVC